MGYQTKEEIVTEEMLKRVQEIWQRGDVHWSLKKEGDRLRFHLDAPGTAANVASVQEAERAADERIGKRKTALGMISNAESVMLRMESIGGKLGQPFGIPLEDIIGIGFHSSLEGRTWSVEFFADNCEAPVAYGREYRMWITRAGERGIFCKAGKLVSHYDRDDDRERMMIEGSYYEL